jgi:hypothetical protein
VPSADALDAVDASEPRSVDLARREQTDAPPSDVIGQPSPVLKGGTPDLGA